MGFWFVIARHEAGEHLHRWCMGCWQRLCRGAARWPLGQRDRQPPGCQGCCLRACRRAVLHPAQPPGWPGRRHQLGGLAIQPGPQLGRQPVMVTDRLRCHLPAVAQGEHMAIVGADVAAVVPVDGAGGAQTREALLGAGAGAPPAMHAAAELAADRRGAAGSAGPGAGATARCQREVGVAPARRVGLVRWGGAGRHAGPRSGVRLSFLYAKRRERGQQITWRRFPGR